MKTTYGIAAISLLFMTGISVAQNRPDSAITPPGEQMPTEAPLPTGSPPPADTNPAVPAPEGPALTESRTAAPADATPVATDGSQTIAANVIAAERLSTLESAVLAAELGGPLGEPGPFTVFAPDNAAFGLVRAEALQQLLQPANRAQLTNVLQAHVVAGRVTAADLTRQIQVGGGRATLTTIGGDTLTASMEGDAVVIRGANNSRALVTQADANASNGVIHIVNGVLLPAD
jgi:uncharacterized surface protein with fasciclin (FAS1) repeats